ncbi:MAG: hypothetical protein AAGM22_21485 [Acidobacteriota bacterium]
MTEWFDGVELVQLRIHDDALEMRATCNLFGRICPAANDDEHARWVTCPNSWINLDQCVRVLIDRVVELQASGAAS